MQLGAAYHCFCPKERLDSLKKNEGGYDGHCRQLSTGEVERNLQMGIANAIRLKVTTINILFNCNIIIRCQIQ